MAERWCKAKKEMHSVENIDVQCEICGKATDNTLAYCFICLVAFETKLMKT